MQFKSFVRNVHIQKSENIYEQNDDEYSDEIMVDMTGNDTTNNQLTAGGLLKGRNNLNKHDK